MKAKSLWRMFSIFAIATGLSLCFFSCSKDDNGNGTPSSKIEYTTIEYVYEFYDNDPANAVSASYLNVKDLLTLSVEYIDENGVKQTETCKDGKFNKKFKAKKLPCTYSFTATPALKDGAQIDTLAKYNFYRAKGRVGAAIASDGHPASTVGSIDRSDSFTGLPGTRIAKLIEDHCKPYSGEIKVKADGNIELPDENK